MNPAISIIVPVCNNASTIGKCLDSILAQTFTDYEVIVINNGSTDDSGEICEAYARRDKRINVIHPSKKGVSVARNIGVRAAVGDYIGFVDSDDYIDMHMYQMLYQYSRNSKCDIAICQLGREVDYRRVNVIKSVDFYIEELNHLESIRQLFKGNLYRFSLCNKLFKRSCFRGVYFPEGRIHEDLSTTYRLFANANKAVYVHYTGYLYVKRDHSILTSSYYKGRLDALTGWEEIIAYMQETYPQLIEEVLTCFTYNCIDHAYSILHQVTNKKAKKSYLSRIQICMRKHYKDIQEKAVISLSHRLIVRALTLNVKLFILSNYVKKKVL